jgi:hypothetical protein
MKLGPNFDVAKTVWWPGATPFLPTLRGPKSLRFQGSLPATFGLVPDSSRSFCHAVHCRQSLMKCFPFFREDRDAFTQTT